MKRLVIIRLSILISLVLFVKCEDAETFNVNDDGDFSNTELDSGGSDEGAIDTESIPVVKGLVGGGSGISAEDETNVKCIVCRAVIEVMIYEIEKVDPRKRIEVTSTKSIQYSKSETYLSELMEDLCEYMDTFATVRQVIVQKTILKSMLNNDGAVEDYSGFDPENLSPEQLNYFCLQVLEENDESLLQEFMKEVFATNIDEIICTQKAKYCDKEDTEANTDRDEL